MSWYRSKLAQDGTPPAWRLGTFRNGHPIEEAQRLIYRFRSDLQRAFPDPYEVSPGTYLAWWQEQGRIEFPELFDPQSLPWALQGLRRGLLTGFVPLSCGERVALRLGD